jgi:DNA-binding MarR family transcriptional regulator
MAALDSSTVYLLKRAELAVRGCVEMALAELEITPSQFFVLLLVKTGEATSSAELARAMGMLPQSMTDILAPLEKRGAIARRPDTDNNRILRAELTAAGERLFATTAAVAERLERELLADFPARDLENLNRSLAKLTSTAETHSFHPKLRRVTKIAARATPDANPKKAPSRRRAATR